MIKYDKILLTGAAGKLGRQLRSALRPLTQSLVLTDIVPIDAVENGEEIRYADLANEDEVFSLMDGVAAVVHLGGIIVEAPFADILRSNIVGTHNVWEGARRAGTSRIVYASSCHAVGMYRRDEKIDSTALHRPDSFYGLSKAFGEDLARLYFDRYGIEAACLRIGSCSPEPTTERMLATWLSYPDLARLVTSCLSTPYLGYAVLYGMSANPNVWWDNSKAGHVGYQPQDSAEAYRDRISANPGPLDRNDPTVQLQAGFFVEGLRR
jgi:uronate dehydrogenase